MPAGASLERFGEKDLVFIKWRLRRHCFKNKRTLVSTSWNSLNDNKKTKFKEPPPTSDKETGTLDHLATRESVCMKNNEYKYFTVY